MKAISRELQPARLSIGQSILATQLSDVREILASHLRDERSGGCVDEAVSMCPHLATEADRLHSQHPELLTQLDNIIENSRILLPTAAAIDSLRNLIDEFAASVQHHEDSETRILQLAFGKSAESSD